MKKLKAVKQKDLKDCGVCCMQWIFLYYDGFISLEKLREDTLTDSDGTNALYIVNAFKKWGFDASGVLEHDLTNLMIKYPCIAHLVLENGLEHFVVIKEVKNNTVYLMDPGIGNKKMTVAQFQQLFTGHLILVHPREKIIKMEKGLTISKIFLQIINKEKFLMLKIIFTSILWSILLIVSSYYLKIGSNILGTNQEVIKYIIFTFGIVTILKILMLYIREYYENHLSNLVDSYLYPNFFQHLFFLPLKNIKSRSTGEIVTRVEELANIKNLFSDIFVSGVLDSLMMFISIIILFLVNKNLFFILFLFMLLYIIFGIGISKIIYHKVLANIDYQTNFNSGLVENIEMMESIKNLNIVKKILFKIEKSLANYLFNSYQFNSFLNLINLGKDFIIESCFFLINSYGFWSIMKGNLTIVDLFTFNLLLSYCLDPVKNLINLLPKFNYIKASFSKIAEFINIEEEKMIDSKINLEGDIVFNKVCYSYNNYENVFENLSFTIPFKTHVLLNGRSGSGKSTVCKLIYKENNPSKGEIFIDNKNIIDLDKGVIKENILYVSQNEKLFTGTIKENIFALRDISEEDFQRVCKICDIESIVSKKGLRYDSVIEPSSKNLSGGEKQRIILARGLLKRANIIILDEALSETDRELESKIIKNIRDSFQDKTIIYISHKNQMANFENVIDIGVSNEIL